MLKHQQRCHEFSTSRKRIIVKESQQVTSPDSNIPIPIRPQKCLHDRQHMSFQGRGHREEDKLDNNLFTARKLTMLNILPK
jgi:hypothetical protein